MVHLYDPTIHCSAKVPLGIESMFKGRSVPFVIVQTVVVVRVDNGVFALGESYAAIRIAITEAAIQ